VARTRSTMHWPLLARNSTPTTGSSQKDQYRSIFATFDHMLTLNASDLISQTLSLLPILGRSLNGETRRRLLLWILGVTWFHGPSRISLKSKTVWFSYPIVSLTCSIGISRHATNNCHYEGSYEGINGSLCFNLLYLLANHEINSSPNSKRAWRAVDCTFCRRSSPAIPS
jgi:hypothetical protein